MGKEQGKLPKDFDMEQFGRDLAKLAEEEKEKWDKIKADSKHLCDLVVTESFYVREVLAVTKSNYSTFSHEVKPGIRGSFRGGEYSSELVLKVKPESKDSIVRTLSFRGISTVSGGDHIIAKIPRYEEITSKIIYGGSGRFEYNYRDVYYLPREFRKDENVIEISILDDKDKVSRTDRAVDYS
ncbi:MAG: hypothetical protein KJ767_02215, partial [Nanoarchaeota archaeon]|nr:hypothetical protein [Nanoarchaeota archaeon]